MMARFSTRLSPIATVLVLLLMTLPKTAGAIDKNPAVPIGLDNGRLTVAIFGRGIDYTHPVLVQRLARDGEGLIIGYDLVDNDLMPYPDDGSGDTDLALALVEAVDGLSVAPYRAPSGIEAAVSAMAQHAALTPAKIIIVTPQLVSGLKGKLMASLLAAHGGQPDQLVIAGVAPASGTKSHRGAINPQSGASALVTVSCNVGSSCVGSLAIAALQAATLYLADSQQTAAGVAKTLELP